jgi:hypothetical protein
MKAISRRSITLEARAPSNQDGQITFEELCRIWLANPERARKMAEDTSEWMFYRRVLEGIKSASARTQR